MINKKYKGIFYIVLSAFFFALMSMFIRLSGDIPSFQKAFFRNFVALIMAFAIMIKNHEKIKIKKLLTEKLNHLATSKEDILAASRELIS